MRRASMPRGVESRYRVTWFVRLFERDAQRRAMLAPGARAGARAEALVPARQVRGPRDAEVAGARELHRGEERAVGDRHVLPCDEGATVGQLGVEDLCGFLDVAAEARSMSAVGGCEKAWVPDGVALVESSGVVGTLVSVDSDERCQSGRGFGDRDRCRGHEESRISTQAVAASCSSSSATTVMCPAPQAGQTVTSTPLRRSSLSRTFSLAAAVGGASAARSSRQRAIRCLRKRPARSPSWRMRTKPWGRTWSRKRRRSSWMESARTLGGHPKPPDGRSRLRQRIVMDGEDRLEAGCLASRVILL